MGARNRTTRDAGGLPGILGGARRAPTSAGALTAWGLRALLALAALGPASAGAIDLVVTTNTTLPAGTHVYGTVTVKSGVTLTVASDPTTGFGSTIDAASVVVETGATISADSQGYGRRCAAGRPDRAERRAE